DAVTGIITTVAGNGIYGYSGDGDIATAANLAGPAGLAIDMIGNLLIADSGNSAIRIVKKIAAPILPGQLTIAAIADQIVAPGQSVSVTVSAHDQLGNDGLILSLIAAPQFVTLIDNGKGNGTIQIAPPATDIEGGRVIARVTNANGLF